jgi:hypothetical protein
LFGKGEMNDLKFVVVQGLQGSDIGIIDYKKCDVSYLASRHGEIEVANANWRTSDVIPKEP